MTPLIRYTLLQLPGLLLLGTLGWWGWSQGWLSAGTATIVFALWLTKDVLLYPLYRPALERTAPCGGEALVGLDVDAVSALQPEGWVRVRGERWRAKTADGSHHPAGTRVRVVAADGLVLSVVAAGDDARADPASPRG